MSASDVSNNPAAGRGSEAVFYLIAIAVGGMAGLIGTAFHFGVDRLLTWPHALRSTLDVSSGQFILIAGAVAATMCVVSVWLVRTLAPEAAGSGVQEIEGAMEGLRTVRWRRILPVKFFGGFLSLGSGLVVGREGPTIHMGAAIAQAFSERLQLTERERRGLLAAGGAAGLAAAFSAPLASVLFVIEETRRQFPYSLKAYTGVMLASVTSAVVTEALAGRRPFMAVTVVATSLMWLPAFAVLGILLGILGVVFNRTLIWSMDLSAAIGERVTPYLVPALVGFAVGVLLILRPEATMGGDNLAVRMVGENLPLTVMATIVLVRFVMTMASYSTGVPGGIFAPILALATAIGLLYALILSMLLPLPAGTEAAFGVAAMGGLFAATVRAPLVGVVLVVELTGAYSILVPAMITCLFANFIAEWLGGRPIYEVLLERTLARAGQPVHQSAAPTADGSPQIGGWDQR